VEADPEVLFDAAVPADRDLPATGSSRAARWWGSHRGVVLALGLVVVFNVVVLHGELRAAAYPNQSGVHAAMVRWADEEWSRGSVPLDGWWPYLSGGLPQFHQAESGPQILTSILGLGLGPNTAYRVALFALLALWPVGLFAALRVAEVSRLAALCSACLGSLVVSASGTGYEFGAYVWAGRGFFAQLWGMWLLAFAWAACWRAVRGRLNLVWAAAAVGAAFVCHFALWPFLLLGIAAPVVVRLTGLAWRLLRALLIIAGGAVASSWALVPLLADLRWANRSAYLVRQAQIDAPSVPAAIGRLLSGEVYDSSRIPVLTALVAAGVVLCVLRVHKDERARGLLVLWVGSLAAWALWPVGGSFFGSLAGGSGTTPPQLLAGLHLAGILLSGSALAWLLLRLRGAISDHLRQVWRAALLATTALVALAPAWIERAGYALESGRHVGQQQESDSVLGPDVAALAAIAATGPPGRIATFGSPSVGEVPLAECLLGLDVDVYGNLLKTSSLSSDPEAAAAADDPVTPGLFAVRYLMGPAGESPPEPGDLMGTAGSLALWRLPLAPGYVRAVGGVGPALEMDRTDVARATRDAYVGGSEQIAWRVVAFDGDPAGPATVGSGGTTPQPPGSVTVENVDLGRGDVAVSVDMDRRAYVALSASMHGRWHATVDGSEEPVWMLAPSFLGVAVEPGRHTVVFEYRRIGWYPWLFLAGAGALAVEWAAGRRLRSAPLR